MIKASYYFASRGRQQKLQRLARHYESHELGLSLYFSRDFVFPPLLLPVANMAVGKNKRLTKGGKKGAKKKM